MNVLLIDFCETSGNAICGLDQCCNRLDRATCLDAAAMALGSREYDLVLIDAGQDGFRFGPMTGLLRTGDRRVPAIILLEAVSSSDRVRLLGLGFDYCLVKPVSVLELAARMRAIVRRSRISRSQIMRVGNLAVDPADGSVLIDDQRIVATPSEFRLLEVLVARSERVVTKAQIKLRLRRWDHELSDGAVEVHVHRLRQKISNSGAEVCTVRGTGYLLRRVAA